MIYPFIDSDNEASSFEPKLQIISTNEGFDFEFDAIFEKQLIMSRKTNNLGNYLSY
jgi:hypothetical protein